MKAGVRGVKRAQLLFPVAFTRGEQGTLIDTSELQAQRQARTRKAGKGRAK